MVKTTKFYNLNAEKHLLLQMLIETNFFSRIRSKIEAQVFYFQSHQILYRSIGILYQKKIAINLTNLLALLHSNSTSETIINYLISLFNDRDKFQIFHINESIKFVLDSFIRRELQTCCFKIIKLTNDSCLPIESIVQQSNRFISTLHSSNKQIAIKSISELLLDTILEIDKRKTVNNHILTGFFDLDHLLHGLQMSDLIIIAGRPSMGKTAFMLSLIRNVADVQSLPILLFSLEMSSKQIIYRLLANETNISTSRLKDGHITLTEWEVLSRAITLLSNLNIYLDDETSIDVVDIQNKLYLLRQLYPNIALVVIDYLQLLEYKSKTLQRHLELTYITRYLKLMAKNFDVPVIVLSQLSRNVEFRLNKRPILSDLRESGCLSNFVNSPYFQDSRLRLRSYSVINNKRILTLSIKSLLSRKYYRIQPRFQYIKRQLNTGHKFVYKLSFLVNSISITIDHYIFTLHGWKRIWELNKFDLVAILDIQYMSHNNKKLNIGLSNVIFLPAVELCSMYETNVYDFWIPKTNSFFVNAVLVHNSIEQDADVVLFLYRDSYYKDKLQQSSIDICEIIVAKHRHGPVGTISLLFDSSNVSFKNLISEK